MLQVLSELLALCRSVRLTMQRAGSQASDLLLLEGGLGPSGSVEYSHGPRRSVLGIPVWILL